MCYDVGVTHSRVSSAEHPTETFQLLFFALTSSFRSCRFRTFKSRIRDNALLSPCKSPFSTIKSAERRESNTMVEPPGRASLEIDDSMKIEEIVGDEQLLWRIVQRRDSRYYSSFVFGVKSTGIFCRPTCPSRRAKRSQVVFFPTFREARAAGFRACLRCTPEDESREPRRIQIVKRSM